MIIALNIDGLLYDFERAYNFKLANEYYNTKDREEEYYEAVAKDLTIYSFCGSSLLSPKDISWEGHTTILYSNRPEEANHTTEKWLAIMGFGDFHYETVGQMREFLVRNRVDVLASLYHLPFGNFIRKCITSDTPQKVVRQVTEYLVKEAVYV